MARFVIINPSLPAEPTSYLLAIGVPICINGTNQICYIEAANNGNNQPVIDFTLLAEIVTALNIRTDTTNVKLKA